MTATINTNDTSETASLHLPVSPGTSAQCSSTEAKQGRCMFCKIFLFISCLTALYFARRWKEQNIKSDIDADYSLKVFNGTRPSHRNYANKLMEAITHDQLSLNELSLTEKIAINRRMFNVSLEYYQKVDEKFKSNELRQRFGTPAQERLGGYGLFEYKFKGTGKLKIMVVGNSHATHIIREMAAVFQDQFEELTMFAIAMCAPIYLRQDTSRGNSILEQPCTEYNNAVLQAVEYKRPDVLYINFYWGLVNPSLMTSPEESTSDSLVTDLQAGLNRFVPYTKLIYFNMPHLEFEFMVAPELSKRLWQGLNLDVLNIAISDHLQRTRANRQRMELLECEKCIFIDWSDAFCEHADGICHAYDEQSQLAFFIDKHHFSFLGCLRIRSLLENQKKIMLDRLK
ncbi:hypothetical protein Ddc_00176 [Ditylenchus destructor]|nr:hypothetical protein Ddc_00176 [Ditylenchus destructor]